MLHQNIHSEKNVRLNPKTKRSFLGVALTIISSAVFFAVLIYSVHIANNHISRVYTTVQKHTQFLNDIASTVKAESLSRKEGVTVISSTELSICAPVKPDPKTTNIPKENGVDPDDSSAENAAELKSTKLQTAKCKDSIAPAATGSNPVNKKTKAAPFPNKSKTHGAQKHFGVGLRFTI